MKNDDQDYCEQGLFCIMVSFIIDALLTFFPLSLTWGVLFVSLHLRKKSDMS